MYTKQRQQTLTYINIDTDVRFSVYEKDQKRHMHRTTTHHSIEITQYTKLFYTQTLENGKQHFVLVMVVCRNKKKCNKIKKQRSKEEKKHSEKLNYSNTVQDNFNRIYSLYNNESFYFSFFFRCCCCCFCCRCRRFACIAHIFR